MKIVFRASDIGFSEVYDIGAFKAIDNGIISSANVMLDGIDAVNALKLLRDRPWISIEWQRNLWEKPVVPADQVPSMVNEDGYFKWGHDKKSELYLEATYEDSYREFDAEVQMCLKFSGRYPCATGTFSFDSELDKAFLDVCKKYDIKVNPYTYDLFPVNPEFKNSNYHMVVIGPDMLDSKQAHYYDLTYYDEYDPEEMIKKVELFENNRYLITMHPGFVDDHVAITSSMTLHRIKEYVFATSPDIKKWIIKKGFRVVNQKDMLLGTNDYQNHLRNVESLPKRLK